ncbi:MAG: hypothetical protein JWP57_108, partial [Spirosoma sp.]|nr:hypothetical protein [Spirosoma sp.]
MKNLGLTLVFGLLSAGLFAQNNVSKIDTGQINGAKYRILFPQNWKGKVILYAHGYEFMGSKP